MNASCTASSAALRSCRTKSAKRSIERALGRSKRSRPAGLPAGAPSSSSMPATLIEPVHRNKVWSVRVASRLTARGDRSGRRNSAVADFDPTVQHLVDHVLGNDAAGHAESGRVVLQREDLLTGMELAGLKPLDGEADHVVDMLQRAGDHGGAG